MTMELTTFKQLDFTAQMEIIYLTASSFIEKFYDNHNIVSIADLQEKEYNVDLYNELLSIRKTALKLYNSPKSMTFDKVNKLYFFMENYETLSETILG